MAKKKPYQINDKAFAQKKRGLGRQSETSIIF